MSSELPNPRLQRTRWRSPLSRQPLNRCISSIVVGLLLSVLPNGQGFADQLSELRQLVIAQDFRGITLLKGSWEEGWESEWQLVSATFRQIDHFRPGIVLEWQRSNGDHVTSRTDAFEPDGTFYWAAESVRVGSREIERGGVAIGQHGRRMYRVIAVLGPKDVPSLAGMPTEEIRYYELQTFQAGRVASIYCSELNFTVTSNSLDRVPHDALLIQGQPVLEVEARRGEFH